MQDTPYYTPYNQGTPGARRALIFFYILSMILIAGLAASVQFHTYLTYQTYQQGRCTIQSESVERHTSKSSTWYTPHLWYTVQTQNGQSAQADGYDAPYQNTYSSSYDAQQVIDGYTIGQTYDCWYNPVDPTHAVLVFRGYSLSNLTSDYIFTTLGYLVGLLVLSWIFRAGVYRPIMLMVRGTSTEGKVVEHIRKRQKSGYKTYSRITFQSQSYPSASHTFETSGSYPIGSAQPVYYDPENLKNSKYGGRPTGCGPAFAALICLVLLLMGAGIVLYIWYAV